MPDKANNRLFFSVKIIPSLAIIFVVCSAFFIKGGYVNLPPVGIQTDDSYSAEELIRDIFISGNCDNVSNIKSIGNPKGMGYFENAGTIIGLEKGIILSTGEIGNAEGPNSATDYTGNFNDNSGDIDLNLMSTSAIKDAVGLSFDFVPLDSIVTFRYVFASEEYCEFVGSNFNDVFGFFISGPGIDGPYSNNAENVARIPGTNDLVTINSVNHEVNSSYYIRNERPNESSFCGIPDADLPFRNLIEFDGFTKQMVASLKLYPCETYHIRMVVADVGDPNLDSAVFLEAESFNLGGTINLTSVSSDESQPFSYEGCSNGYFLFGREDWEDLSNPVTINFEISEQSSAIVGEDFEPLPESVTIPAGESSVILPVEVILDNETEDLEKLVLKLDIPCACYQDSAILYLSDPIPFNLEFPELNACKDIPFSFTPTITGGVPGYQYFWEDGSNSEYLTVSINQPTAFSVTVTDDCGQLLEASTTIGIKDQPKAELTGNDQICLGDTAIFLINFTGDAPWQIGISRNDIAEDFIENISTNPFEYKASKSGVYKIIYFEDAACEGQIEGSAYLDVIDLSVEAGIEDVLCYGDQNGRIDLSVSGGSSPYIFVWEQNLGAQSYLEGIAAGNYSVTIEDQLGCQKVKEFTVDSPEPLSEAKPICEELANGNIKIEVIGGTPPYYFAIDGGDFQGEELFYSLEPGIFYDLSIRDVNGCTTEQEFLMPATYFNMVEMDEDQEVLLGDTVQIEASLNIPSNLVSGIRWIPEKYLSCSDCLNPTIEGVENTAYILKVIDFYGCIEERKLQIHVNRDIKIFFPTAFSPNGDGINDIFIPLVKLEQVTRITKFSIYDRWGGQVYAVRDLVPNSEDLGWDGTYRNKILNEGVYVYQVKVELIDNTTKNFEGSILLIK